MGLKFAEQTQAAVKAFGNEPTMEFTAFAKVVVLHCRSPAAFYTAMGQGKKRGKRPFIIKFCFLR